MLEKIKEDIDRIVWWIPVRKLRDSVRNVLLYRYNVEQDILNKLNCLSQDIYNILDVLNLNDNNRKNMFEYIYNNNLWGSKESLSGPGSTLKSTENVRNAILNIVNKYGIKTVLDAPCGDMNWMKEIVNNFDHYIGVDIVEKMINSHKNTFNNKNIEFKCMDITKDELSKVDLVFSRDCIQHLTNNEVMNFINNIKKSNSKYLLISTTLNINNENRLSLNTYQWQYINLEEKPFNFPKALEYIYDCGTEDDFRPNTFLGLYEIDKL